MLESSARLACSQGHGYTWQNLHAHIHFSLYLEECRGDPPVEPPDASLGVKLPHGPRRRRPVAVLVVHRRPHPHQRCHLIERISLMKLRFKFSP